MNARDSLLESIDLSCFLEHIAPGEWERFGDEERAFDFFVDGMTQRELKKELDESGCRNEPVTKEPTWASLEGLKQAVNDLISANDRLFGEVDRLRSERDMYWEYWLAANDLHHLEESLGAGVPIPNGSRDKAVESINMIRSRIEEWQNDL